MKRSAFDDRNDQRVANDVMDGMGNCAWCKRATLKTTLGQYGARCHACFDAYCQEGAEPVEGLTRADKLALLERMRRLFTAPARDPKAWARELREREDAGEILSSTQRRMWRAALREAA